MKLFIFVFTVSTFFVSLGYANVPAGWNAQFVEIPHGTFQMGSPLTERFRRTDETPHSVTLTHDFEMQATDVTQLQWFLIMGNNPSANTVPLDYYCGGDFQTINNVQMCASHPVDSVTWYEAQSFIEKLNRVANDGYTYRLPTEAEWEYSARAGTVTECYWGSDDITSPNLSIVNANAWNSFNSKYSTHPVGLLRANSFGLYDMEGNIYQWVQDTYGPYPSESQTDPTGAVSGDFRVVRGSDYIHEEDVWRSASRGMMYPGIRSSVGFRLVRTK